MPGKVKIFIVIGLLFLTACTSVAQSNDGSASIPTVEPEIITPTKAATNQNNSAGSTDDTPIEPKLLGGTNIAQHSVPLEDIHFDTFNGASIPLSIISETRLLRLRDAIPPIETPQYTDVETANDWLRPADIVIGYVDGETALAYPTRILNYHEIVNEEVNGVPILISYCPLCNSGIVYDRRVNGQTLEFGNTSALYQSDMVMYDRQTFSYWFQVEGAAIVGDLTGQQLEVLPTRFMRWSQWRATYPNSQVLSTETGFRRPYERDPFIRLPDYLSQGRFPFPVDEATANNQTLPAGEQVVSVTLNGETHAYPLADLSGSIAHDMIAGVPVAVVINRHQTAQVFDRRLGEQTLTFEWSGDVLVDAETRSHWILDGLAVSGPLAGEQLEIIPSRFSFWFAVVAAFPEAKVFEG